MRILMAAILMTALAGCIPSNTSAYRAPVARPAPAPTWTTVDLTDEQRESGMASVRNNLKDPDSAKFSELYGARRIDGEGSLAVCGFVNAKNSYGGYAGKKRFFAFDKIAAIWNDRPKYGYSSENEMLKDICLTR